MGIGEGSELHAPADGAPSLALLLVAALLGAGVGVAAVTFSGIVSRRRGVPESETPRPVMDFAV